MFRDPYKPTQIDFLPSLTKAITPGGKEFYLSDIGNYHLQFIPKRQAKWTVSDKYGNLKPSVYSIVGKATPKIDNAYFSKTLQKAVIEFNVGSDVYRAALDGNDFDLASLESLPGTQVRNAQAQVKANSAAELIELDKADYFSKVFYSMFGVLPKDGVKIVAGVVVGGIVLKTLLKGKK